MKSSVMLVVLLVFVCMSTANAANTNNGYTQGHPNSNPNYYTPDYNRNNSTPNYDTNYYNKTYNNNSNSDSYNNNTNDAPHGNDIRDYNPYYDRNGNLKR